MSKVYIVYEHDSYDGVLEHVAAFEKEEDAKALEDFLGADTQTVEVNPPIDNIRDGLLPWAIRISPKGRCTSSFRSYKYFKPQSHEVLKTGSVEFDPLWAPSRDEAIRIAKEQSKGIFKGEPEHVALGEPK